MTETQGNSRSMARLLITGLITSRCLVLFKGREKERGRKKEKTEKRDINAWGEKKEGKGKESDTEKARRERVPRNKLTPVDVVGVPLISS